MPLPLIPVLLGAAALGAAGYGVKKGIDASDNFDKAKSIGEDAQRRHEKAVARIEHEREQTNARCTALGKRKAQAFDGQIRQLIKEIKKRKSAGAMLKGFEEGIAELDLPKLEKMVSSSYDLLAQVLKSGAASTASAALAGMGALGSVGALATASTGTAIASLSGAAATNATLAWLGGGSLAAGGLGVAGGTAVLGGVVAGPAIAVLGLVMASQAEEAVTKARAYEAKVDTSIAEIDAGIAVLEGLQANVDEQMDVLDQLTERFDEHYQTLGGLRDERSFATLMNLGMALKQVLDMPVMQSDGKPVERMGEKIRMVIKRSGVLEIA